MTTLAQALAARGIAPADIAAAELRAKASGGGFETAVLELGLLTEPQAVELVVELSRMPRPPKDLVEQLSPAAAPLFPQQLAERHGMVPLGLQRRQLQLMVRHPVDLAQIDEIGFLLSRPIKLYVGTELEIIEAMKEVYGLAIPTRFVELRTKLGGLATAAATPEVVRLVSKPPDPAPSAPTRPPFEHAPVAAPALATEPSAPPKAELEPVPPSERPTLRIDLVAESVVPPNVEARALSGAPTPAEEPAPESRTTPAAQDESLRSPPTPPPSPPSGERGEVAPPATPSPTPDSMELGTAPTPPPPDVPVVPPPLPPRASLTVSIDRSGDPSTADFWDEAGDLLSMKPRAPALPAPSVPVAAVQDLPAEPSPFEVGPFEAQPVEALPLTSGFAGRSAVDRRISTAEALASLRAQTTRDGVVGTAINFLRGAFDFVAIFTRHGDAFQVFEASGVDYGGGADLSQTVVDLDRSRVLRTVVEGRAPYVGQVPAGDPLESALGAVGRARLRAVLLYPVVIRDRTVAIVHGDRGGEALAPRQLSDVALVLAQLGAQLERVLRARRRAAGSGVSLSPIPRPDGAALASPHAPAAEAAAPTAPPPSAQTPVPLAPSPAPDPASNPAPSPPSVPPTGAHEDDLALNAAALAEGEPFEVPIDWVDVEEGSGYSDQVRAFLSGDPPARAKAAEILRKGGADAAWALSERFPGPLFVFRMAIDELPGPDGIGPILGLMAAIGVDSIPALLQLADASGEERRFWATVLLAKLGDERAIEVLSRRLLDSSPDVALAARRGLYRLRKAPAFAPILDRVTAELTTTSNPERLTAIVRALGHFHHVPAVPRLIALVGIRDPQISSAAADALRELTRQDFGTAERRWSTWWNEAKNRPRLQWLIEALESRDRDVRLAAISELTEIAGLDFGYRSDIEPRKQEGPLGLWHEWWEREGRNRAEAPAVSASPAP